MDTALFHTARPQYFHYGRRAGETAVGRGGANALNRGRIRMIKVPVCDEHPVSIVNILWSKRGRNEASQICAVLLRH
jgi:hypothetical protein